jgi:hypothetical protein
MCHAPEDAAPELIQHAEEGHCFFARQPLTPDEIDAAVLAIGVSCCGAVRYGGNDPQILTRLTELDCSFSCDHPLPHSPAKPTRPQDEANYGWRELLADLRELFQP